jgi:endoglucanase
VRAAAAGALVALLATACGAHGPPTAATYPPEDTKAVRAAQHFLDRWVDADGRVVRRDQGGDTVSEGQGYALLIAVATRDEVRFARVWEWTRLHLLRPDGLLAYHWKGGHVVGSAPAADADTQVAWALDLAGRRFHRPEYTEQARRLAEAVVEREVGYDDHGAVTLAAGPWAVPRGKPATVEPGYWTPTAATDLATLTGDRRWQDLAASDTEHLRALTDGGRSLPPDWALIGHGPPRAIGAPGASTPPQHGPDGMRASIWASCTPAGRRLISGTWPLIQDDAAQAPMARHLDGSIRDGRRAPLAAVVAAATAASAGKQQVAWTLLDDAQAVASTYPTYYGDAWVALGRLLLQTDRLARCGSSH